MLGNGTDPIQSICPGANGEVLMSNGTTWVQNPVGENPLPFYYNNRNVTSNVTIGATENVMSAGPIVINDGVTVTILDGGEWTIV